MCGGLLERLRGCCASCPKLRMAPSSDGVRTPRFWQAVFGESIGTLMFVLLGCGSWIETGGQAYSPIRISLTFGLLYAALVYVLRYVSGGHLNPAVTLAALATKKISILRALLYIFAQSIGAIVGAALLLGFTPKKHQAILGSTVPQDGVSAEQAFAVEFVATLVLTFVWSACSDRVAGEDNPPAVQPFVVGLTLVAAQLYAVPISGGGLNPARSLGPSVVKVVWTDHWVYWFGPLLGGVGGALIYDFIFASNASLTRVRSCMLANERRTRSPKKTVEGPVAPEEVSLRHHTSQSPDDTEDLEVVDLQDDEPPGPRPKKDSNV